MYPYTKKACTIKCTQAPLIPVFAMTAHHAQGQTLRHVIVDLESCRGAEAPYVMVSRATSLEGLLILQPFQMKKIMCQHSEDMHSEKAQLHRLNLSTCTQYGTPDKSQQVVEELTTLGVSHSSTEEVVSLMTTLTMGSSLVDTLDRLQCACSRVRDRTEEYPMVVGRLKQVMVPLADDNGKIFLVAIAVVSG
ncbi:hypothetical protein L208DRAFT_1230915 [Tricholoma matsutake]|nr:hypothetical protein L208DRAFT_1230915 [Tricholoma matsutake 945]